MSSSKNMHQYNLKMPTFIWDELERCRLEMADIMDGQPITRAEFIRSAITKCCEEFRAGSLPLTDQCRKELLGDDLPLTIYLSDGDGIY